MSKESVTECKTMRNEYRELAMASLLTALLILTLI
jgi:hypothetical protein